MHTQGQVQLGYSRSHREVSTPGPFPPHPLAATPPGFGPASLAGPGRGPCPVDGENGFLRIAEPPAWALPPPAPQKITPVSIRWLFRPGFQLRQPNLTRKAALPCFLPRDCHPNVSWNAATTGRSFRLHQTRWTCSNRRHSGSGLKTPLVATILSLTPWVPGSPKAQNEAPPTSRNQGPAGRKTEPAELRTDLAV